MAFHQCLTSIIELIMNNYGVTNCFFIYFMLYIYMYHHLCIRGSYLPLYKVADTTL